jgi:hypothetical protein
VLRIGVAFIVTIMNEKTGGLGIIIEVESKFCERKYHRGHRVEGVWVIGGIERTASRALFVAVVEDRSALTILELLTEYVANGVYYLHRMLEWLL